MNILIVGLGVIGGAYAQGLKEKHHIFGSNRSYETLQKALNLGIIDEAGEPEKFISKADLIVLGIYPKAIIEFLKKYQDEFKSGTIITDVTGVKSSYIYEAQNLMPSGVEYVSAHPMAGKEKKGLEYADKNVFIGANFLITATKNNTEAGINIIKCIAKELKFGKISVITPEYHDRVIAFTSQLTHAIAVSLVNSDDDPNTPINTGDSYRELTRIAKINEELWSELFLENRDNLLYQMDKFIDSFMKLRDDIKNNNQDGLKEKFVNSTKKRMMFDEKNRSATKE